MFVNRFCGTAKRTGSLKGILSVRQLTLPAMRWWCGLTPRILLNAVLNANALP